MDQHERPALMTAEELAQAMQVHVRTVRRMAAADRLPHPIRPLRLGQLLRFRRSEVEAALSNDQHDEPVAA